MTNLEALRKIYQMALHAKDLKGVPWTDEEKEALTKANNLIAYGATECPALNTSEDGHEAG